MKFMNEKTHNKQLTKVIKIILILISLLLISKGFSQSITWQRLYDVPGLDRSVSKATCLADGNNFYSGGTAFIDGNWRIYVMKVNLYGDTIWTRRIDTLGTEIFAMVASGDGGCVITGDNNYTIKLSSTGSVVWAKYYGGEGIQLYDIIKITDGGYIACGELFDVNNFTHNGYLLKIDVNGNLIWQQTYITNDYRILSSIVEASNGLFVVTGTDSDFFGDTVKIMLLKINSTGGILLDNEYTILGRGCNGLKI